MFGQMSNLWQQLQDGSGVQRADSNSDEKDDRMFRVAHLQQRHDEDSGEGEDIDHCHAQERKAPHWRSEWQNQTERVWEAVMQLHMQIII